MSLIFRTATAAAGLFVLGACTTTALSPVAPESAEISAPEIATASPAAKSVIVAEIQATPAANETLLYGAMTKWELMTFVETVTRANLQSALEGEQPMTVFAPNNQAFEYARLSDSENIRALLQGHMIDGAVDLAALIALAAETGRAKLTTQAGTELTLYVRDDVVKIAGPNGVLARITQGDMVQSNGVMHQISSVLEAE